MSVFKVIRTRIAWGLFGGILIVEWHSPHHLWSVLGFAAVYAVGFSVHETALVAANQRWPQPLRWPWRRRGSSDGTSCAP